MLPSQKLAEVVAAWDDALKRLHAATAKHEDAHRDEAAARCRTSAALNEVNAIQRELDKLDADLRSAFHPSNRSVEIFGA